MSTRENIRLIARTPLIRLGVILRRLITDNFMVLQLTLSVPMLCFFPLYPRIVRKNTTIYLF